MFLAFLYLSLCSTESIYGGPNRDEIVVDESDSFELLSRVPKPTTRHISEAHLTSEVIPDDAYPRPGKKGTASQAIITAENDAVFAAFCTTRNNYTQEELYYHPAGSDQFLGNDTLMATAPRVKARIVLNPKYSIWHATRLYVPPGELITIDIPPKAVNQMYFTINPQCRHFKDGHYTNERFPKLQCEQLLTREHNTFGWPYGGSLSIRMPVDKFANAVEINISGCIQQPYFLYGVTTDEKWHQQLNDYPAPLVVLENRLANFYMPRARMLNSNRVSDLMHHYRAVGKMMYDVAETPNFPRRKDGRVSTPVRFNYDSYVHAGAAVATQGANTIQMPFSWIDSMSDYEHLLSGYWGTGHEYGHHFQGGWGMGARSEVSNNIYNILSYNTLTPITETRRAVIDGSCSITSNDGWSRVAHGYKILSETDLLAFYGNLVYAFGHNKTREALYNNRVNTYTPTTKYTNEYTRFLGAITYTFQYDFEEYFGAFGFNTSNETTYSPEVMSELRDLHYKPFHPIALLYESGFIDRNGEEVETGRPFVIGKGEQYVFDFIKYVKSKVNMSYSWKFVSVSAELGSLKEMSEGKYKYTPPADINAIDRLIVTYKDTSNDEERKQVVRVRQTASSPPSIRYYTNLASTNSFDAYEETLPKEPVFVEYQSGMQIPTFATTDYGHFFVVQSGVFVPEESARHMFTIKHSDDTLLFYFSDSPLKGNPTDDAPYLRINETKSRPSYSEAWDVTYNQTFEAGKKYYFKLIMFRKNDAATHNCFASAAIKKGERVDPTHVGDPNSKPTDVSASMTKGESYGEEDSNYKFVPQFENLPYLGKYFYTKDVRTNYSQYTATSFPTLVYPDNIDRLFDGYTDIGVVRTSKAAKYPLVYNISFGRNEIFNEVFLYSSTVYPMDSDIKITVDDHTVAFEGHYVTNSPLIKFDRHVSGSTMQIYVYSNSKTWTGESYSGSSFCEIRVDSTIKGDVVVPITNTKGAIEGNYNWTSSGLYYNGYGLIVSEGSTYKIWIKGVTEVTLLGDLSLNGASGKVVIDGNESYPFDTAEIATSNKTYYDYLSAGTSRALYQTPILTFDLPNDEETVIEVTVEKGELGIAGFVVNGEYELLSFGEPEIPFPPPETPLPEPETPLPEPENPQNPETPTQKPETPSKETETSQSSTNESPNKDSDDQNSSSANTNGGSNTGLIVGIVIAVVVVAAVVAVVLFFKFRKTQNETVLNEDDQAEPQNEEDDDKIIAI